jgi:hypothetical protein
MDAQSLPHLRHIPEAQLLALQDAQRHVGSFRSDISPELEAALASAEGTLDELFSENTLSPREVGYLITAATASLELVLTLAVHPPSPAERSEIVTDEDEELMKAMGIRADLLKQ